MCWPGASIIHFNVYTKAREQFVNEMKRYPGHEVTMENNQCGVKIRFRPYGQDVSCVILLNSYFEGEEMCPPVSVFTENEGLSRFVESSTQVKIMRESMKLIRNIIKEDRMIVRLKYGYPNGK